MALRIVFALTCAVFALLIPAERLGLQGDYIKSITMAILLGAGLILGLSAIETHFKRVFQKPYGALSALSLILGVWLFLASRMEPLTTKSGSALLVSTQLIIPMISFALSTLIFLLLPQPRLKATQECFTLGSLLLSAGLLLSMLSSWFTTFMAITDYGKQTALLIFSIAGLAVALGGSMGVKRLSAFFAGIFLVFVLFPFVLEMSFSLELTKIVKLGDFFLQQLNQMPLTSFLPAREGGIPSLRPILTEPESQATLVQNILFGVALAWFFTQNLILYEKRWVGLKVAVTALFLCAAIISLTFYASLGKIAIAQSNDWPILLGLIANLLIPMLMLCPLLLLLHSWGSRFSESVANMVQTPVALKSSLIAWMRIGVVMICFCLILALSYNLTLSKLHLAVLCSIALFIFVFGYLLAFFTYILALPRKIYSLTVSLVSPTP